jgi:hypothetical protein
VRAQRGALTRPASHATSDGPRRMAMERQMESALANKLDSAMRNGLLSALGITLYPAVGIRPDSWSVEDPRPRLWDSR